MKNSYHRAVLFTLLDIAAEYDAVTLKHFAWAEENSSNFRKVIMSKDDHFEIRLRSVMIS
jgi:hypothetical protein